MTFLIQKTLTYNEAIKKYKNWPKIEEQILSSAQMNFGFQFVAIKNNDERPENRKRKIYDA